MGFAEARSSAGRESATSRLATAVSSRLGGRSAARLCRRPSQTRPAATTVTATTTTTTTRNPRIQRLDRANAKKVTADPPRGRRLKSLRLDVATAGLKCGARLQADESTRRNPFRV